MFAVSFLVLYLELALIRWVTGYVHNFGYFTNFAMLAAFLGVGLGCLLARRPSAIALLPCFLLGLALIVQFGVAIDLPAASRGAVFWSESIGGNKESATLVVVGLFLLIALAFVGLGQPLGALFSSMPRLRAYAFNVAGALTGILLFAVNAALAHPPIVWFAICTLVAIPFLGAAPKWTWPVQAILMGAFLTLVVAASRGDTWSPYYRQTLLPRDRGSFLLAGNGVPGIEIAGFDQLGNTYMYEAPYAESTRALRKRPDAPIRRVLVIGCGGGNDVAMALQRGALHVDAVDINPWVIEMGKAHHPLHPFDSERVTTWVADGREFLARHGDKYDLIVYGLPDSTFTNDRSNLRVESFIFTLEAFQSVRARLSDDGIFVVYNFYRVPWLVSKIAGMLRLAFAQEPVVELHDDESHAMVPATLIVGPGLVLPPPRASEAPPPATDDWPFLYLSRPSLPSTYASALAAVFALTLLLVFDAVRSARRGANATSVRESPLILATLFLMGVAFTLLETRSVVTFGLLFGSTWWNNVVVFAAIHVSVLGAVLVGARFPALPLRAIAVALVASLAVAWLLPPEALLFGSAASRGIAAGAVAFLPVFCANVLFVSVFRHAREGSVSYGANLFGGMLGGLIEYASLVVGYRALVVVAAVLYLAAMVCAFRYRAKQRAPAVAAC
jgi:SAM-dependent methyltransferase